MIRNRADAWQRLMVDPPPRRLGQNDSLGALIASGAATTVSASSQAQREPGPNEPQEAFGPEHHSARFSLALETGGHFFSGLGQPHQCRAGLSFRRNADVSSKANAPHDEDEKHTISHLRPLNEQAKRQNLRQVIPAFRTARRLKR